MLAADFNPFSEARTAAPATILNFLAITLFMSLDLHHSFLIGFQRTYALLPIGGARLGEMLFLDVVGRPLSLPCRSSSHWCFPCWVGLSRK